RLLDNDVDNVLAIPVARLTQEGLHAVIMVSPVVDEAGGIDPIGVAGDGSADGPAREGAGTLFDVILRIVGVPVHAHSHREQLQELTAVVLVNGTLVAHAVVQVEDHTWVSGDLQQDVPEAAEAIVTEHIKLDLLLSGVLDLGGAGA